MTERLTAIVIRTCPVSLHRRLKSRAGAEGLTIQKLVLRIIAEYLEKTEVEHG